jgi:retron-type reverse transcriptase
MMRVGIDPHLIPACRDGMVLSSMGGGIEGCAISDILKNLLLGGNEVDMALIDDLDLNKAFRRIEQDRRDDAWPDVVGYRDYKRGLIEYLSSIQETLRATNLYKASLPLCIDVPKKGYTLRPGVVPLIDDRIIYQAIADLLAPHFIPEASVYSNRLAGQNMDQMFIQGVELWVEFQNKVEEYCQQYPYVVETDIAAYFDHINHNLLYSRIHDLFKSNFDQNTLKEICNLLRRLLRSWNIGLKNFGIPQINDASSFMANLYLDELDKWLLAHRYISLRYVDDIRIFTENEPKARKALAELIETWT